MYRNQWRKSWLFEGLTVLLHVQKTLNPAGIQLIEMQSYILLNKLWILWSYSHLFHECSHDIMS